MRKKVLYTATVDVHILSFHLPYLKMLQEKGYEVHVATNGTADIPYCDVRHTVPFARSPFKPDNLRAIKQLKVIIDRENYDLIHTHTPMGGVVTRLAALSARKRGTRVIYTAHGFHFFNGAPVLNWLVYYPIEKLLAYKTDDLITINQEDYQRAKAKFKTKVHYVPGVGVDPKKFDFKFTKADKTKLRKSLGLKDSDFVMIYPAELNDNKNQTMLIEVMEKLIVKNPNIHLLLPGKDSLNGLHKRLIEQKELVGHVHLLGFRSDIPKLLKIANLSVSASIREGLGLNIVEAMTVGLPVVASSNRGHSDIVSHGSNGYLVGHHDIDLFLEYSKKIIESRELSKLLGARGKELSAMYSRSLVMKRMREIYG